MSLSWHVTVDQFSESGAFQRYEYDSYGTGVPRAVTDALIAHRLQNVEAGEYQITVVRAKASDG